MNAIGEAVDERGPIESKHHASIHAAPPDFVDQSTAPEVLETGIKVVDLLAPYARGVRLVCLWCWCWLTVFIQELINNIAKGTRGYSVFSGCW